MSAVKHGASSGGNAPRVASYCVVALYEAETGRVDHMHSVVVFEGGQPVTDADAIETARAHAARLGLDQERLSVAVSHDGAHARGLHRINPNSGEFQAIEPTSLRGSGTED
jgi:hypothetical protein